MKASKKSASSQLCRPGSPPNQSELFRGSESEAAAAHAGGLTYHQNLARAGSVPLPTARKP